MAASLGARWSGAVAAARFRGRNARYHQIFDALRALDLGTVVDVGGGRVAEEVEGVVADRWIVVEPDAERFGDGSRPGVHHVRGDGHHLPFPDGAADTVVSIQVLEHVFEPFAMLAEMVRVTRPGGALVVVLPQTANVHELPHHYQNFTRFWIDEAVRRLPVDVERYEAMGGAWGSVASRLVLQWATVARVPGHHDPRVRRGLRFWLLAPLAALVTGLVVPVALLLGTADIAEEANNHLVVLRRR